MYEYDLQQLFKITRINPKDPKKFQKKLDSLLAVIQRVEKIQVDEKTPPFVKPYLSLRLRPDVAKPENIIKTCILFKEKSSGGYFLIPTVIPHEEH